MTSPDVDPASSSSTHPVAPAPWTLHAEAFWFLSYNHPLTASSFQTPAPNPLPAFSGGLTTIQFVRYSSSPVGPYDELLYIPGSFPVPGTNEKKLQITRIYVSEVASVYNGRKNWNIDKRLARFEWTRTPGWVEGKGGFPYERVKVYGENGEVCFEAEMKGAGWGVTVPMSTLWSPLDLELVNPPLKEREGWEVNGEVGTEGWCKVVPKMEGKVGGFWGDVKADGVGWPDVGTWSLGAWWKEVEVTFPEGEWFNVEDGEGRKDK